VEFNPFSIHLVRVVDSYGKPQFLDVVSPSTDTVALGRRHLASADSPLGRLMRDLEVESLAKLSPMLSPDPRPSWPLWYRDICEWATLYDLICYRTFATDTLIVRDGLLRSKLFAGDLFIRMYRRIKSAIARAAREQRRSVFLVGIAKRTQILQRYALAMALAGVFPARSPCFAPVPLQLQRKVYLWEEYVRRPDEETGGEEPKFNMGSMFFARFGARSGDPVWTVDLLAGQEDRAQEVFGYLLADATVGFPVPFYPLCLQQADQHAQVVDLDLQFLQDALVQALREQVGDDRRPALDAMLLATDVMNRRYG
jgi:hypothetical protein